jgi:hypothetical protein
MEAYLQALVANDASSLRLAKNLKATENAEPSDFNSGLWKTATRIGSYKLIIIDKESGHQGFVGLYGEAILRLVSVPFESNSIQPTKSKNLKFCWDRIDFLATPPQMFEHWIHFGQISIL